MCCRTPLLQALIALLELPEDDSIPDDEHFIEIEDTPGYQAAFCQLKFSGEHESDPCADVNDVKVNLALKLQALSQQMPGQVRRYIHLTLKVLVMTIDAQWEGMGDVGSARYEPATTSSMPDHKGFKLQ